MQYAYACRTQCLYFWRDNIMHLSECCVSLPAHHAWQCKSITDLDMRCINAFLALCNSISACHRGKIDA